MGDKCNKIVSSVKEVEIRENTDMRYIFITEFLRHQFNKKAPKEMLAAFG
jgi:hypothetical protein